MGRSDSLQCLQQKSCHLIHTISALMRNGDEDDKRRNEAEDVIDTGNFVIVIVILIVINTGE